MKFSNLNTQTEHFERHAKMARLAAAGHAAKNDFELAKLFSLLAQVCELQVTISEGLKDYDPENSKNGHVYADHAVALAALLEAFDVASANSSRARNGKSLKFLGAAALKTMTKLDPSSLSEAEVSKLEEVLEGFKPTQPTN